jgi:secreted PhoX family phosphatase
MSDHELLPVLQFDRRKLLGLASGTVAATMFGPLGMAGTPTVHAPALASYNQDAGFGDLIPDPKGRLALPSGFQYRETSPVGSKMSNGELVPDWHDGIAAFAGPDGATILVRNHEISYEPVEDPSILGVLGERPYDGGAFGGTTAVVVNADCEAVET